jgi:hypothetical protein
MQTLCLILTVKSPHRLIPGEKIPAHGRLGNEMTLLAISDADMVGIETRQFQGDEVPTVFSLPKSGNHEDAAALLPFIQMLGIASPGDTVFIESSRELKAEEREGTRNALDCLCKSRGVVIVLLEPPLRLSGLKKS